MAGLLLPVAMVPIFLALYLSLGIGLIHALSAASLAGISILALYPGRSYCAKIDHYLAMDGRFVSGARPLAVGRGFFLYRRKDLVVMTLAILMILSQRLSTSVNPFEEVVSPVPDTASTRMGPEQFFASLLEETTHPSQRALTEGGQVDRGDARERFGTKTNPFKGNVGESVGEDVWIRERDWLEGTMMVRAW
ncbi:MAG: hypothetical protein HQL31_00360 [Planctomycetes bacterium]|nr:hypothetical protein [Planctomycetota bacterium]